MNVVISNQNLEEAEVIWLHPTKSYGFAQVLGTKEEIFFHFNNARLAEANEQLEKLVFKLPKKVLRKPYIGEVILFVRAIGSKNRSKASPWISFDNWSHADMILQDLNSVCGCGHKVKDHTGGWECMYCHCGHQVDLNWSPNDPDNFREINLRDDTNGFKIYE